MSKNQGLLQNVHVEKNEEEHVLINWGCQTKNGDSSFGVYVNTAE